MSVIKVKAQKDFTIVYNVVLENPKLSFKAKGLWAYCMSRPDNWEFHVNQLATVSEDGVDAVYSALKELIAEGLVEKVQRNEKGKFGSVDYIIYPYPGLKKCLPQTVFPHAGFPQTANPALLSTDSYQVLKKEIITSDVSPDVETSPLPLSKKEKKEEPPLEAYEIAELLWGYLKKIHPNHKPPNFRKWAETVLKCHSNDNRSWQELKDVLAYIFEKSDFWFKAIQSPTALAEKFDQIWIQMHPPVTEGTNVKKNRELAQEIKQVLIKDNAGHELIINSTGITRQQTGESVSFNLPPETFTDVLVNWFQLRRKS